MTSPVLPEIGPRRTQSPEVFEAACDALFAALPTFEANMIAAELTVGENAGLASTKAAAAAASAVAAAADAATIAGHVMAAASSANAASGSANTAAASATTATQKAAEAVSARDTAAGSASAAAASAATAQAIALGVSSGFPSARPAVFADFANGRFISPGWSFSRAGSSMRMDADGVMRSVAANVPAWNFGPDGKAKGIAFCGRDVINLAKYSGDLTNAWWVKKNVTISAASRPAPDGSTMWKMTENLDVNQIHSIWLSVASPVAGQLYTFSCFVRDDGVSDAGIRIQPGSSTHFGVNVSYLNFNPKTGQILSIGPSVTNAEVEQVAPGVYRIGVTAPAIATGTSVNLGAVLFINNIADWVWEWQSSYDGNGSDSIEVWGLQWEQAACMGPYVPTTSAAVTRPRDVLALSASALGLSTLSSLSISISAVPSHVGGTLWSLDDVTTANAVTARFQAGNLQHAVNVAAVEQAALSVSVAAKSAVIASVRVKANDFAASVNKAAAAVDSSCAMPAATTFRLGNNAAGTDGFTGTISSVSVFPLGLSNADIQSVE